MEHKAAYSTRVERARRNKQNSKAYTTRDARARRNKHNSKAYTTRDERARRNKQNSKAYTKRDERARRNKQNSKAMSKEKSRTVYNVVMFRKPSLSWSNYIKLPYPMWVSCSPPLARVQWRLVVDLVDVPCTSTIVEHPRTLPSGVTFRHHHLFLSDVDWILSI